MAAGAQGAKGALADGAQNKILRRILQISYSRNLARLMAGVSQKHRRWAGKGLAREGGSAYLGPSGNGGVR